MSGEPRRIAHLDMDAFFASVELLEHPELKGLPVVVGGRRPVATVPGQPYPRLKDYAGRGVATTATYEARAFGVHSGMGLMKAAALAPEAILLPAHFEAYARVSRAFKAAVAEVAPLIEDRGIDEIYLDLTDVPGTSRELGLRLKAAVRQATGLSCSIGITPNKLLSKLASELEKPDGLTILGLEDLPARIWPLPCRAINGIGPKAAAKLEGLHLRTIGELARADPAGLVEHFGRSYGAWLHEAAHGRDDRPLTLSREPKSISRETTFERDLHAKQDREALSRILLDLCERLAQDLARKGVLAGSVGIKLRFEDFQTVTRDQTLPAPIADAERLREAARTCLKRVDLTRKLRLLGVRAGALVQADHANSGATRPVEVPPPGLFDPMDLT
ncbi:MAG: DNA polymerase IV [Geothrix sp.]|uniref:DNA polymerase IV n=1 Tax=Geothrix sp. TaxID=1962974 RepID=UPI00179FB031|nr:DNA polymerase IV [Geothrix sp.]NWJ41069.1 DNA polymerase IV [Geothrix sp.]WIL20939.1 MAG: DNA polymerase IV [Geothrix sp.]